MYVRRKKANKIFIKKRCLYNCIITLGTVGKHREPFIPFDMLIYLKGGTIYQLNQENHFQMSFLEEHGLKAKSLCLHVMKIKIKNSR